MVCGYGCWRKESDKAAAGTLAAGADNRRQRFEPGTDEHPAAGRDPIGQQDRRASAWLRRRPPSFNLKNTIAAEQELSIALSSLVELGFARLNEYRRRDRTMRSFYSDRIVFFGLNHGQSFIRRMLTLPIEQYSVGSRARGADALIGSFGRKWYEH